MRKHLVMVICAGLLISLVGCGSKDSLDTVVTSHDIANATVTSLEPATSQEPDTGTQQDTITYDIENAVTDPTLISIIQGDIEPIKVIYGRGGEAGYDQYESTDDIMIKSMINGLRLLHLSDILYGDVPYIADGNEDIIFCLEDGTKVSIAFDGKSYVHTEQNNQPVVYVFSNIDTLSEIEEALATGQGFN